jgi:hypothetical protein
MLLLSRLLLCLLSFFVLTLPSSAFQMQPVGTEYDRKLAKLDESKAERLLEKIVDRGAPKFFEPVHEEITQRIYECNENWGDKPSCAKQKLAPQAVIDGARWNDNPPFMVNNDFTLPNGKRIESKPSQKNRSSIIAQPSCTIPRKLSAWYS